jgi:hypothetical protein
LREKNGLKGRLISCAKVDAAVELSWITNSFIQFCGISRESWTTTRLVNK